jgi:hypothetical protein
LTLPQEIDEEVIRIKVFPDFRDIGERISKYQKKEKNEASRVAEILLVFVSVKRVNTSIA